MSSSHVCADVIFNQSGRLIEIGFIAGFKFSTGFPGRTKFSVAHLSAIASVFVIFNTDVECDVSIGMGVGFLVTTVFHHHCRLWQVWQIYC